MSFDRLARHYRWMELVLAGNKLQRCRTRFLERVKGAEKVLLMGEGNGRFLRACRREVPGAEITVLDASEMMLREARQGLEREGLRTEGITFLHADALKWRPARGEFDLVVSHFFLDCFRPEQLEMVVGTISETAREDAAWLVADFQAPSDGWHKRRAELILASMYAFFRWAAKLPAKRWTPPDSFLQKQGFVLKERKTTEWGLLRSDLWQREGGAVKEGGRAKRLARGKESGIVNSERRPALQEHGAFFLTTAQLERLDSKPGKSAVAGP